MKATLTRKDGSQLLVEGTPSEISEIFSLGQGSAPELPAVTTKSVATKPIANKVGGKREMSEATRKKIADAQTKRWAKVRAGAKKATKAKK